ncbi:hypothetical protein ACTS95_15815 [Empedobacter brevis]
MNKIDNFFKTIFNNILKNLGLFLTVLLTIIVSIILIITIIYLITHKNWIFNLSNFNEIGDAFGGLSSPFIGVFGVLFTFLAFYVQYTFNKKQFEFYNLDKIDRKVNEYALYLDKLTTIEGNVNTAVIHIVDKAANKFSELNINNLPYSFEKESIESFFLELVDINSIKSRAYIHNKRFNNNPITIEELEEQIIRKFQVYHKFCYFLELIAVDFENNKIPIETIQDTIKMFIRKFEISYPMHSFEMSNIFILHYSLVIQNKVVLKPIMEYHKNTENYDNIIILLKHHLNHLTKTTRTN